jgi:peptidoglycan hydrolase-like protein with peptidoglycan-binding domain
VLIKEDAMKKAGWLVVVMFVVLSFIYGCNIVPKSVQYQKEEEELIGSVDVVNIILEEIQVALNKQGYDTGNVEGRMCQKTREAIKEFQESMGIKSTGYIDKLTLTQIEDLRRVADGGLKKGYGVEVKSAYPEKIDASSAGFIKPGIRDIQTALKNAGFDPGAIDGKIGPRTQQAIKEFQRAKGLKVDGVVGPRTWGELEEYLKK